MPWYILMPETVRYHNGGTNQKCTNLVGPCACGAWHHADEWSRRTLTDGTPVAAIADVQMALRELTEE